MITFRINYPLNLPYRTQRNYLMRYEVKFYLAQCQKCQKWCKEMSPVIKRIICAMSPVLTINNHNYGN